MGDGTVSGVHGDVLATMDEGASRFVLVGVGVAMLLLAGGAAREGAWPVMLLFGLPGVILAVLPIRSGRRLILTSAGMFLAARTNTFTKERVVASVPIADLLVVRYWREARKSKGSNAYSTAHVMQVCSRGGDGFRSTQAQVSSQQLEAMRTALGTRGLTLEVLERAPS